MLMRSMRRTILAVVFLVAASVALEPLLHTHPLSQSSPIPCAVCVSAVGRITAPAPAPAAPQLVAFTLRTPAQSVIVTNFAGPRASRAPPAA